jgi:hypothetical protein
LDAVIVDVVQKNAREQLIATLTLNLRAKNLAEAGDNITSAMQPFEAGFVNINVTSLYRRFLYFIIFGNLKAAEIQLKILEEGQFSKLHLGACKVGTLSSCP